MNKFIIPVITILIGVAIFVWLIVSARKLSEGGIK